MVAANAKYQTGDFLNEVNQAVASNQPEKLMGILSRKIGQYAANNKKSLIAAVQRGGIDVQQNISDQALFSVIANNIYKGNKRLINSVVYEILPAENLNDSGHSDSELNHSPSNNTGPTNTTIPDSNKSAFDVDKFNKITTAVGGAASGILNTVFGYLDAKNDKKDSLAAQNRQNELNNALSMQTAKIQAEMQAELDREKRKETTTQIIVIGSLFVVTAIIAGVVIIKVKKAGTAG